MDDNGEHIYKKDKWGHCDVRSCGKLLSDKHKEESGNGTATKKIIVAHSRWQDLVTNQSTCIYSRRLKGHWHVSREQV